MGSDQSRAGELNGSTSKLFRCLWYQNKQSFDDFYEPTTITTAKKKKFRESCCIRKTLISEKAVIIEYRFRTNSQHLNEHFRNTRRVKSKCREISKDSLASTNLLNDSMTSNFELQQQKEKTANYVMKSDNDASVDYVSYLHLSHDSITKANCCFSNDLKTKSCYVLLNRRLNRDDRSFSCSGKEDCHITNPVQVYGYNNTVGTVSDSVSSNYKVISFLFIQIFISIICISKYFIDLNSEGRINSTSVTFINRN
ncbi:unnamed protein product [Brugia pahangi]|uniref:FLYWCH-type domain-containing protein n=1 Tax=Brugia pahangi TaxID=6280 RepID=A0A0N4T0N4_BRUPA|nr:unnamed protein product [Brugia pahangi]